MSTIKAPFNFVPLNDKVFFPDWADKISQDIPFEDGMSGVIELKITAETPMFVRNGHTKEDADAKNEQYTSFSNTTDNKYFIPATSIKGCIRNVMEIMSFGKMGRIDNKRYSIRDLQLKKYLSFFQNSDVHCGWMTLKDDKITITDNGIPRRISHLLIDEKYGTDFCTMFSDKDFLKKESNRSPLLKYKKLEGKDLRGSFKEKPMNPNNIVDKRIMVYFDNSGEKGTIVLTGQPSYRQPTIKDPDGKVRKKASGKFYEFVFYDKILQTFTLDADDGGLYEDFKFIYKDSDEWKYWKAKLEKGQSVPVFMSIQDGQLKHFGLSYLYKLPFNGRIKDYLLDEHKKKKYDLSDCIFGYAESKNSLKGRVTFSNAFWTEESGNVFESEIKPYLGGPKPTYYPIYLKQNGQNGYMCINDKGIYFSTMLDNNAQLKGWKRYPIQSDYQTNFSIPENQEKNTNPFIPLSAGSVFVCNIHYHNLRKCELGALISAIDLPKGCLHSIGFAKPFGYGAAKIEILNLDEVEKNDLKKTFSEMMSDEIVNYGKSSQLKELFSMMRINNLTQPLEYMDLDEFVKCKKQHFKEDKNQTFGEYLQFNSELIKKEIPIIQNKEELSTAKVTVFSGPIKQAALLEGKNAKQSKPLEVDKQKLKIGDLIEVKVIRKGGNIEKFVFVRKI